jgi:hypothetical protein
MTTNMEVNGVPLQFAHDGETVTDVWTSDGDVDLTPILDPRIIPAAEAILAAQKQSPMAEHVNLVDIAFETKAVAR